MEVGQWFDGGHRGAWVCVFLAEGSSLGSRGTKPIGFRGIFDGVEDKVCAQPAIHKVASHCRSAKDNGSETLQPARVDGAGGGV
jgi:hypothetical protein